jgi:hypothetical protein
LEFKAPFFALVLRAPGFGGLIAAIFETYIKLILSKNVSKAIFFSYSGVNEIPGGLSCLDLEVSKKR